MTIADTFDAMANELKADSSVFRPSALWSELNAKNAHMLEAEGLANFKRTVSQNYFNWFIADREHPLFEHARKQWWRRPNLLPWLVSLSEAEGLRLTTADGTVHASAEQRDLYRLYVCYVWTIMSRLDKRGLRFNLSEPEVGNPFPVRRRGRKLLSQDLANSIIECNLIADLPTPSKRPRLAEIGAGYGRVAHAYLNTMPGQYFIFDIPPALGVAQWYLEQTLGRQRVFRFRPFERIEDVQDEMDRASAVLLTANQISKFPDGYFDVMLSISTFPEMRQDQVDMYLAQFQRLSRSHIFIKQYKTWRNPSDGTDLTVDSYRLGANWRTSVDRTDPVIPTFFNRVWSARC